MAQEGKLVIRTRLGRREVDEDAVIRFPRGLIGFEERHEFVLIQMSDDSPFLLLQAVDDPGLGLVVADPYPFVPDYEVQMDSSERRILGSEKREDLAVLVTVTIPKSEPQKATLNLLGPIIMNTDAKVGIQVPQVDSAHPPRFSLVDGG